MSDSEIVANYLIERSRSPPTLPMGALRKSLTGNVTW